MMYVYNYKKQTYFIRLGYIKVISYCFVENDGDNGWLADHETN
ncbi:MAG: hypothetical protein WC606_00315 [Candidatus Absconditabacterales bacterium]